MSSKRRAIVVAGLLLATVATGSGPSSAAVEPNSADRNVRSWAIGKFGFFPHQVVVVRDGEVVASAASAPGGLDVPRRLASISKTITAVAVFRLVEAGRLSLDTRAIDVLPELFVGAQESWSELTVDDLLTHRSGLPKNTDQWFSEEWDSCKEAVTDRLAAIRRSDRPSYLYSNTNYCMLSLIVAAVTKKPYAAAVRSLVLAPLGIENWRIDVKYLRLLGAGAWQLSPLDVARLFCTIDPGSPRGEFCADGFLSEASRQSIVDPTSVDYGRGILHWNSGVWGHSGTLDETRTLAAHLPSGEVVVLMTQYPLATDPPVDSGSDLVPWALELAEVVDRP